MNEYLRAIYDYLESLGYECYYNNDVLLMFIFVRDKRKIANDIWICLEDDDQIIITYSKHKKIIYLSDPKLFDIIVDTITKFHH